MEKMKMPITVIPSAETTRGKFRGLQTFVAAAETVDSYCVDYLDAEGHVDLEALGRERVDHIRRTLSELDAIAELDADTSFVPSAVVEFVIRTSATLASAIREALTMSTKPADPLDGYTVTATKHGTDCDECMDEARSAAIMASVSGSRGAAHERQRQTEDGFLVTEHSATVKHEADL